MTYLIKQKAPTGNLQGLLFYTLTDLPVELVEDSRAKASMRALRRAQGDSPSTYLALNCTPVTPACIAAGFTGL